MIKKTKKKTKTLGLTAITPSGKSTNMHDKNTSNTDPGQDPAIDSDVLQALQKFKEEISKEPQGPQQQAPKPEPEYFTHRKVQFRTREHEGNYNGYPVWDVEIYAGNYSFSLHAYSSEAQAVAMAKYLIDLRDMGIGFYPFEACNKEQIMQATEKLIYRLILAEDEDCPDGF
jgi:hypothetical protein